jgi:hypothetical protein
MFAKSLLSITALFTSSVQALSTESFLGPDVDPPKDYIRIGTFANMNPTAWKKGDEYECSKHDEDTIELINCNLQVYEAAVATAAGVGIDLLVFPEGYGTIGTPTLDGFYDSLPAQADLVGKVPCDIDYNDLSPQLKYMSCASR